MVFPTISSVDVAVAVPPCLNKKVCIKVRYEYLHESIIGKTTMSMKLQHESITGVRLESEWLIFNAPKTRVAILRFQRMRP